MVFSTMFSWISCHGKKSTSVVVADESPQTRGCQRSVCVPDAPAAISNKDEGTPWRYRLFGRPMEKKSAVASQNDQIPEPKKAKKPRCWCFCRKRRRVGVIPAPEEQSPQEQCMSTPVEEFIPLTEEEEGQLGLSGTVLLRDVPEKKKRGAVLPPKTPRQQLIKCLGFPNPAQICYMNSCLQSLLTLKDFVKSISRQEQVWRLIPEAALVRSFMDIQGSHFSSDPGHKIRLLRAFKQAIWSPEFQDHTQKDAHEFLTAMLQQMRCLSPQLQVTAASMGRSYRCPVEDHMVFKMVNTRTCKSCGEGSSREEEFTNLSLHLTPGGGTVEQMLQDYMKETELESKCECGGNTSVLRSSFATLPRVLVLNLKRFRFTPSFQLKKVHDPIHLHRELVVSSNQTAACYSLVSTISHIAHTARSGHYICDGVDPDVGQDDPTDRWFTYNDTEVTETRGDYVCDQRERNAYILFYKRQD